MTALGIHLTDMLVSLAGKPVRVAARTARHVFRAPADDYVAVDIEFAGGVTGRITCLSATPFYGRFTVYGDKGWVEVQEGGKLALSSGPVLNADGKRIATYTSIWRREPGGEWRIIFDRGAPFCDCKP